MILVQADGAQKATDQKDPSINNPGIFSKLKEGVATAVDKVKEGVATAFDKVKISATNLQERASRFLPSRYEDHRPNHGGEESLDQQSKYDLEQVMKFVFRMADLKNVESNK